MTRREQLTAAQELIDDQNFRGAERVERGLVLAEAATHALIALAASVGEIADTLRRAKR